MCDYRVLIDVLTALKHNSKESHLITVQHNMQTCIDESFIAQNTASIVTNKYTHSLKQPAAQS